MFCMSSGGGGGGGAVKKEVMVGDEESRVLIEISDSDSSGEDDDKGSSTLLGKRGTPDITINNVKRCKQFWKAGDYADDHPVTRSQPPSSSPAGGMDHVRVHPRFLHSNATSHKWALGAFAELLDNSLDEVRTGASYVAVDMLENNKDNNSKMLLVQDNGGGMSPDKMRQCMSLGYSEKSKLANTIGQYGNGFKTSTMRLGADVIVFSCTKGKDNGSSTWPTKSIGLLSYTFLKSTGMQDIIVPMIDYEKREQEWKRTVRSSTEDWCTNLDIITRWSPYATQDELLLQFESLEEQGTRVVIYNLWEDDQGQLELDFDADMHDIQIRGVNRDNSKIQLAQQFPNAAHFLTYRHSLRSYTAILYLRVPPRFRIILRGKDVVNHNLANDMIHRMQHIYKPQPITDAAAASTSSSDMVAVVTVGFARDAEAHINIQGFNVYHRNRLIKPFWRVWNVAGSDGRGVIGVLEANFIEPAHDKQGFERSISLSRLQSRLLKLHKDYWRDNCHLVGYAPRRLPKKVTANTHSDNNNPSPGDTGNPQVAIKHEQQDDHQQIRNENANLKIRLLEVDDNSNKAAADLQQLIQYERDGCKLLQVQLNKVNENVKDMVTEKEALLQIFSEERQQRDIVEEKLKDKLKIVSTTIQELVEKVKLLEGTKLPT